MFPASSLQGEGSQYRKKRYVFDEDAFYNQGSKPDKEEINEKAGPGKGPQNPKSGNGYDPSGQGSLQKKLGLDDDSPKLKKDAGKKKSKEELDAEVES